ncbi:hypothetical protein [Sporisorium scitamineum]|uniref:Uncharacterized protein n=1 Tax=Sporisorium scitamineum TaxID=49012 RepID=A0A0F7SAH8_9BASI|nr:hypothetical protein [Sporisorium scitamineum]
MTETLLNRTSGHGLDLVTLLGHASGPSLALWTTSPSCSTHALFRPHPRKAFLSAHKV